eukprot:3771609-Amphidinium_carterae.1
MRSCFRRRRTVWIGLVFQEVRVVKKLKGLKPDDGGNVKVVGFEMGWICETPCNVGVSLMTFASGLNFASHEKWVRRLFGRYSKTPPPGYSKITMAQLKRTKSSLSSSWNSSVVPLHVFPTKRLRLSGRCPTPRWMPVM